MWNLVLLIALVLLILPQPLSKTIKKIWPGLVFLAFLLVVMTGIERNAGNKIILTALDQKNTASKGTEIWLKEVEIDGITYEPESYFEQSWAEENSFYVWRNYDQDEIKAQSTKGNLPENADIRLIFQANKWRGQVEINQNGVKDILDCYKDTEDEYSLVDYRFRTTAGDGAYRSLNAYTAVAFLIVALCLVNLFCRMLSVKWPSVYPVMKISESRVVWLDLLKVLSAFMIVLIHASGNIYNNGAVGKEAWFAALTLNVIPRFAVPCFFMISGVLLLGKRIGNKDIFKYKLPRIVVSLVIWATIYVLLKIIFWGDESNILTSILQLPYVRPSGHLWYGFQLIWIYLSLPLMQTFYEKADDKIKTYFIVITLAIPGVLDFFGKLFSIQGEAFLPSTSTVFYPAYLGLLVLGRFLWEKMQNCSKWKVFGLSIAGVSVGFAGTWISSYYVSVATGSPSHVFFTECQIPVVIYAAGVFLLFYSLRSRLQKLNGSICKGIIRLSNVSLGVYFSHCIFLWCMPKVQFGSFIISIDGGFGQVIMISLIYYIITAVLCLLMSRLPVLRKLVL